MLDKIKLLQQQGIAKDDKKETKEDEVVIMKHIPFPAPDVDLILDDDLKEQDKEEIKEEPKLIVEKSKKGRKTVNI